MTTLDDLEGVFGRPEPAKPPAQVVADPGVTDRYPRRLDSLIRAEGRRYERVLAGSHDYPSDSEAILAVIDAMTKRHFTDGEIWRTLNGSTLFTERITRKGERHGRHLVEMEITKARGTVAPFDEDPGAPIPRISVKRAPAQTVVVDQVDPVLVSSNGHRPEPPKLVLPRDDSFITRYVRYAERRTDAPAEAHALMAVGILSALAGPRPFLPIATSPRGWRLALWCCYIVNSTTGRKTTVINLAKEIIADVLGGTHLIEWEGSPQGLIQKLQEVGGHAVFSRDEYSGLMAQMNRGGHMAGLPQLFIRAFDGGTLENIRTRKQREKGGDKEDDTDRVENPYLVKLTASTWDSFIQRCTIDNVLDGYLARFIFVTGAANPRPLPKLTAALLAARDQLIDAARHFTDKASRIDALTLDDDVLMLAWELEQAWSKQAAESSRPDAAGPSLKRLSEAVLKTAALLAIDDAGADDRAPAVTPDHYHTARALAEPWCASTLRVIEALGATTFMRDTQAVLATVQEQASGIAVRDLMRKHRRLRSRDFEEILSVLQEREDIDLIEVRDTGGRPRRVAYRFGEAPRG